jgi:hypothetical protein
VKGSPRVGTNTSHRTGPTISTLAPEQGAGKIAALWAKHDRLVRLLIKRRNDHRAFADIQNRISGVMSQILRAELREERKEKRKAA